MAYHADGLRLASCSDLSKISIASLVSLPASANSEWSFLEVDVFKSYSGCIKEVIFAKWDLAVSRVRQRDA